MNRDQPKYGLRQCSLCHKASPIHDRRTCPLNPVKAPPRVTSAKSQMAARLVLGGWCSPTDAARLHGVTRQAVYQIVKRFKESGNE